MSRLRVRPVLLALAVLLALLLPGAVGAQELGPFTRELVVTWARGDAGDIAALIAASGVSINVEGQANGPLARRQAGATLRRMFADVETVSITLASKKVVPGSKPPRAWLELVWTRRARGTTIPDQRTVFVALVGEGDEWRITDIRLLR